VTVLEPLELAAALGLPQPTPEQVAVIAAPIEPTLVVAGAGAGKTETMAARVVWLVANGLVTPDRVLGLTFTRKAARQLSDRVRARLRRLAGSDLLDEVDPSGQRRLSVLAGEPTVLTYHAYAGRIVAEHGLRLPVEPGSRLLTETASWQLAHRVVSTWTQDLDTDKVPPTITGYLLKLAGELAEHLLEPDALRAHARRLVDIIENAPRTTKRQGVELPQDLQKVIAAQQLRVALLPLVEEYGAVKRRIGALDFADQMAAAAMVASTHPQVPVGERERYGAVLLDEYQDTGHSQRVLLRSLFGDPDLKIVPVTAVGDPAQAIYGWRGASAANLPRFTGDFPRLVGERREPARRFGLMTSFRNPPEVLALANVAAGPLRAAGLDVDDLRPMPGAAPGDVRCALWEDVQQEREWMAEQIARRWFAYTEATGAPPTAAVLVRRRADMAELAAALRARELPVEVVGIGGLLAEPEVRDLVSALRLLVDPLAGTAAARLLTGSRWRLGAADLAALWARAGELGGGRAGKAPSDADGQLGALADALPPEQAEQAGLADALDDPGDPANYSMDGFRRLRLLGGELAALRRRLDAPLPELVADVERTLLLDIEAMARPTRIGRVHLDAFADVVGDYAMASSSATLPALLDYLAIAEKEEDGLEPGEVDVAQDRVQVLTVHAAKGLEWQLVALPHLVAGVFPGQKRSGDWLTSVTELPADLRGDAVDLPPLRLAEGDDRKTVVDALEKHSSAFEDRRLVEDRRLFYVGLTRAQHGLFVSGHWWGEGGLKPKGPSPFLDEVHAAIAASDTPIGSIDHWARPPEEDEPNPLSENVASAVWPSDPLGNRRLAVIRGAELVHAAMSGPQAEPVAEEDDPEGWARDVDVLLAERAAASGRREQVRLPEQLTVSQLVQLAHDPVALARRLRRPLPYQPNPAARRGTAFHAWLEQRFGAHRLLDMDELPGAADEDAAPDERIEELRAAFLASEWGERTPFDVEVAFETEIAGVTLRGRMDAVYADADGGWTVVDWKTGALPDDSAAAARAVQLAAYRLAWSALRGAPLASVRAAFHYVAANATVRPVDLLDADGLRALLGAVPVEPD
jgi:DNA helicase-2/ATP-dependent DNA helicase PcrA